MTKQYDIEEFIEAISKGKLVLDNDTDANGFWGVKDVTNENIYFHLNPHLPADYLKLSVIDSWLKLQKGTKIIEAFAFDDVTEAEQFIYEQLSRTNHLSKELGELLEDSAQCGFGLAITTTGELTSFGDDFVKLIGMTYQVTKTYHQTLYVFEKKL